MDILRVAKDKLPVNKGTAYNWHSQGKFPSLVYKVAGVLVFDLREWIRMADEVKKKNGM